MCGPPGLRFASKSIIFGAFSSETQVAP